MTMAPELLEMYVFIHYNWQYEWMRPSIEEIVKAYEDAYGREPLPDDLEPTESEDEGGEDDSDNESEVEDNEN